MTTEAQAAEAEAKAKTEAQRTAGQESQDGQKQADGAQKGAEQQQQTAASQAAAAAGEQKGADGTARDAYSILAELLESEEGQKVFSVAAGMTNEVQPAAPATAQAGAQVTTEQQPDKPAASPQRVDLEAKIAAGGDGALQAKADLFDLNEVERKRTAIVDEGLAAGVLKGRAEALKEIFAQPQFQALEQPQRVELGVMFGTKGPAATLTRAMEMVAEKGEGLQRAGTAEEQAARADANKKIAGQQATQTAPALIGAQNTSEAPEIRLGQSPESALNDYFAFQDQQK